MPKAKPPQQGPNRGIDHVNVHPRIAQLCSLPEGGVDHTLLHALRTTYSLDDYQDLYEIYEVQRSHRDAAEANIERARGG